jgi:hypothetical protein
MDEGGYPAGNAALFATTQTHHLFVGYLPNLVKVHQKMVLFPTYSIKAYMRVRKNAKKLFFPDNF